MDPSAPTLCSEPRQTTGLVKEKGLSCLRSLNPDVSSMPQAFTTSQRSMLSSTYFEILEGCGLDGG
jgi:hypothetical protein